MMDYICSFHENILNGIERIRKVNGRTAGRPDGRRARHNTTRLRRAYKNNNRREKIFKQPLNTSAQVRSLQSSADSCVYI